MGYRSTFVSEHIYVSLPEWFVEKYKNSVNFYVRPEGLYGGGAGELTMPISSKYERKFYSSAEEEIFVDLSKVLRELDEKEHIRNIRIALMHEDGEIDRVTITPKKVTIQGLKFDPEDCYNSQLGDRNEEYLIETEN